MEETIMKTYLLAIVTILLISVPTVAAEWESEHPPLPENTRRAIADYKRSPTEANKAQLLRVMNENYDAVIQRKKDNLAERVRDREKNINRWMLAVRSGDVPPFMKLNTENHKGDQRKAVGDAVDRYRQDQSSSNETALREALNMYYDAFLDEQKKHIKETEDARESRLAMALERFTSDRFHTSPQAARTTVIQDEALAEIICAYIAVGAEIVPVNPEARVRERGFNSAINTAQAVYLKQPTENNRAKLRAEIAKAFQSAYDVRLEEFAKAEKKGITGARQLLVQMQVAETRDRLFLDLTQQRNLYGRIDRIVTFGSNTVGSWQPRLKAESRELAAILRAHAENATSDTKLALETKFNALYTKMLNVYREHLEATKGKLDSFIEMTLKELTD